MGEAQIKRAFRRKEVRLEDQFDLVRGLWQRVDRPDLHPIKIIDISSDGFGMLAEKALSDGELIRAIFSQPSVLTVEAVVAWSAYHADLDLWRIGLNCDHQGRRRLDAIYRQIISSSREMPSPIERD